VRWRWNESAFFHLSREINVLIKTSIAVLDVVNTLDSIAPVIPDVDAESRVRTSEHTHMTDMTSRRRIWPNIKNGTICPIPYGDDWQRDHGGGWCANASSRCTNGAVVVESAAVVVVVVVVMAAAFIIDITFPLTFDTYSPIRPVPFPPPPNHPIHTANKEQ
jgi:hypothetical protein